MKVNQFLFHRWWFYVLGFSIALLLLAWRMQPVPLLSRSFPGRFFGGSVVLSPDQQLFACFRDTYQDNVIHPGSLRVFSISTQEMVFEYEGKIDQYGFDADNSLIFINYRTDSERRVAEELYRWQPNQRKPTLLKTLKLSDKQSSFRNCTVGSLPEAQQRASLLAPDARLWLTPKSDQDEAALELIDTATGRTKAKVTVPGLPVSELEKLHVAFVSETDSLVLLTNPIAGTSGARLFCVDVATGETRWCRLLPHLDDSPQILLGGLFICVHLRNANQQHELLFYDRDGALIAHVPWEELNSVPDVPLQGTDIQLSRTHIDFLEMDSTSKTFLYFWQRFPVRQEGESGDLEPLDILHYGVRSVCTGQRRICQPLAHRRVEKQYLDYYQVLGVLPGPILVFTHVAVRQDDLLADCLDWLRVLLKMDPISRLDFGTEFIEGSSGKLTYTLFPPAGSWKVDLSADRSKLFVWCEDSSNILLLAYDYPLHKPWLLILSWSFGVALTITLPVEASRWWKRRQTTAVQLPR
jgi:hypothetical protein